MVRSVKSRGKKEGKQYREIFKSSEEIKTTFYNFFTDSSSEKEGELTIRRLKSNKKGKEVRSVKKQRKERREIGVNS